MERQTWIDRTEHQYRISEIRCNKLYGSRYNLDVDSLLRPPFDENIYAEYKTERLWYFHLFGTTISYKSSLQTFYKINKKCLTPLLAYVKMLSGNISISVRVINR